jgi:hypothetical protein
MLKEGSGWSATHTDACPRGVRDDGAIRHGHARAFTRRVFELLRRTDASLNDLQDAVNALSALVRTRWTTSDACERILLGSPALGAMDRLSAEQILNSFKLQDSHA